MKGGWGNVGRIDYRLGKRQLQHDLAGFVADFENRLEQVRRSGFIAQKLSDRDAGNFPGMIRVAQLFSFRIEQQFCADTGIEKVPGHDATPRSWPAM